MCALQITELHQLMSNESWVAICNGKMPLPLLDLEARQDVRSEGTAGIHKKFSSNLLAIAQLNASCPQLDDRRSQLNFCSQALGSLDQEAGCAGWIEHTILRNQQTARHSLAQIRFEILQSRFSE